MMTFEQFDRTFPTDDACKDYIVAKRWPDGVCCPRCNRKEKVYALKARKLRIVTDGFEPPQRRNITIKPRQGALAWLPKRPSGPLSVQ